MGKKVLVLTTVVLLAGGVSSARYSGGTGEPNNPYRIETAEDLNDIGNHVEDFNRCFVMVNDINLADYTGSQFNLIGYWEDLDSPNNIRFTGVFDGNGHTVSNFTYVDPNAIEVGLFREVGPAGRVSNLAVTNLNVTAKGVIGGLVGLNEGTIANCYVAGKFLGGDPPFGWTGGLVGLNGRDGNIRRCCTTVQILREDARVGGLVGSNWGTITHCCAAGTINAGGFAGGIAGDTGDGTISCCAATSAVSAYQGVGGLIGFNRAPTANCYATGAVLGTYYVGGLAGINNDHVENCYAAGVVSGSYYFGAFVGEAGVYSSYEGCFFDNWSNPDVNGIGNATEPNVAGKTTTEMQTKSTFTDAGWDFVGEVVNGPNDVWDICEGTNYPRLVWQIPSGDFLCPDGISLIDFGFLAERWGDTCCSCNHCDGADLDFSGVVDRADLKIFCQHWLEGVE